MNIENNYCIYAHINKINNKMYIGQTKHGDNPNKRWKNGLGYGFHCVKFFNAIQKYGWQNFEHIVLKNHLSLEEANKWEGYYINFYDSINNGYNSREGGSHGNLTKATKEKLSQKAKEKGLWKGNLNPRHLDPLFGERNGIYGRKQTEETKRKISKANTGRKMSQETKDKISKTMYEHHPRSRKVQCIETGEIFNSAAEAGRKYEVGRGQITRVCKGDRATCKRLHWQYYEQKEEVES